VTVPSDSAIHVDNLARHFGHIRAVDGISLEVPKGIVFGFLGPNGAGKTTTIRLLLGLLEPTAGRAEVLGMDVRTQSTEVRRRSGALLEHPGLYERLTALENLEFYGRIYRMPRPHRSERARELLSRFELWDRRTETVSKWSKGMKQKLAIARALLHRPPLLFLDEPTSGLDALAAASLRRDIASLAHSEGVTVFLTTHNLAEAEQLCAAVAVCREGQIIAEGTPTELRGKVRHPRVEIVGRGITERAMTLIALRQEVVSARIENNALRLELRAGADVAPLIATLVQEGVEVEEVRRSGLEAAFLSLLEEKP
jgi:ABC-2 type transport system ATP-binding protein